MAGDDIATQQLGGGSQRVDKTEPPSVRPIQRGRHDVGAAQDPSTFWSDVDGMLTDDFSSDWRQAEADLGVRSAVGNGRPGDRSTVAVETSPTAELGVAHSVEDTLPPSALVAEDLAQFGAHDLPRGAAAGDDQVLDAVELRGSRLFEPRRNEVPARAGHDSRAASSFTQTVAAPRFEAPPAADLPVPVMKSSVVDPLHGSPPGSSFMLGSPVAPANGGRPEAPVVNLLDQPSRSTSDLVGTPAPRSAVAAHQRLNVNSGSGIRDLLSDLVDRRWFSTALVAALIAVIGVAAFLLLPGFGRSNEVETRDSVPETPLIDITTSTTTADRGSAGAGTSVATAPSVVSPIEDEDDVEPEPAAPRVKPKAAPAPKPETTAETPAPTEATTPPPSVEETVTTPATVEEPPTSVEEPPTSVEETTTTVEETTTTVEETTTTVEETTTTAADTVVEPDPDSGAGGAGGGA